jgi:hypothetical protein
MTLPRILYAVPPTLQARLEIAKTICLLAEQDESERLPGDSAAGARNEASD